MTVNVTPDPQLHQRTIEVLRLYNQQRQFDVITFLQVLNRHENRCNVYKSTMDELLRNPKSKYHLLFSLSGAIFFKHKITAQ